MTQHRQVLFVKTSSLGDIIQSFHALSFIKEALPDAAIDWAVEKPYVSLIASHPLVRRTIEVDLKGWRNDIRSFSSWKKLFSNLADVRTSSYDLLFDLQGNTKSALLTLLAKARAKVGFGKKSVREWPNLIATTDQYETDQRQPISDQYVSLIQQHLGILRQTSPSPFRLKTTYTKEVDAAAFRIMVSPGSRWKNKQLDPEELLKLLKLLEAQKEVRIFFIWGSSEEEALCNHLARHLQFATVLEKLDIPVLQNLMWEMDLFIGVDSAALHLCSTTPTPTFSIFGPTSKDVFKPSGAHHLALQGACPYNIQFNKLCPRLRTCPTGACIKQLTADALFSASHRLK